MHASAADPLAASGAFAPAELRAYPWEIRVATADWVGLASTISDHQRLASEELAALLRSLRATIDDLGGIVRGHVETYALLNRRL